MKRRIKRIYVTVKHLLIVFKLNFRKPNYSSKVFCIGFNKTGTTSLGKSLKILGYKNSSFNKVVWGNYYKYNKIDKILDYTAKFDSCDDLPWLKEDMIPILDKKFPNSKFIYLTRDELSWRKSIKNWTFKRISTYPDVDEKYEEYKKHEKFVMNYFKDRLGTDLLILEITDKKGFKKLSTFLGRENYSDNFPHFNKT